MAGASAGRSRPSAAKLLKDLDNGDGLRWRGPHGLLHGRRDDSGLVGPDRRITRSSRPPPAGPARHASTIPARRSAAFVLP